MHRHCLLCFCLCSPCDCEEVKAAINLLPPGSPTDPEMHPSIVVRIFRQKIKKLEELLRSGHIFGQKLDYLQRTHEWQKRGLIHCHIMIRLKGAQPVNGGAVDRLISGRLFLLKRALSTFHKTIKNAIAMRIVLPAKSRSHHQYSVTSYVNGWFADTCPHQRRVSDSSKWTFTNVNRVSVFYPFVEKVKNASALI